MSNPLHAVRTRIVEGLLLALSILGSVAAVISFLVVEGQLGLLAALAPALAAVPVLVGFLARHRLGLRTKTVLLVGPLLALSFQALLVYGLPGAGLLLLALASVLTTALLGLRWGLASLSLAVLLLALAGALLVTGAVQQDPLLSTYLLQGATWTNAALNFALLVAVMVVSNGLVERQLRRHVRALETSNASLRQEMEARQRLEAQLVQAQRAEALSTLAGGVAHDLNNLLTVVQSNTALALMDVPEDHPLRDALEGAQEAARGAGALVERLLAFARLQVLEPRVLDLGEVVRRSRPVLERVAGEAVRLQAPSQEGVLPVCADPTQLQRVLVNLVANARDASPDGGLVQLGLGEDEGWTWVEVRDQGTGMDEATRLRAFEPFFTTKAPGDGTGLGLAAVQGIVEQHGGRVTLESTPGEGTRVRVLLPRAYEPIQTMASLPPETPLSSLTGRAVLLVDDQPLVRRAAARAVERLGYRVVEAGDGPQALAMLAALPAPPDLLLTDVVMPGMDGMELAQRLLEQHPDTPVLFISGHPREVLSGRTLAGQSPRLLRKPFSPEALAEALEELLEEGSSEGA